MDGRIKIVIADDQELIRESLKIVLSANPDMEVTDTVADGREVIRSVRACRPDVILMDVRMPEMDGVSCTRIIKENYPQIKIIILTTFDDDEYVYNALKYGASGYLLKGVSMAELSSAIRTVHSGKAMINPDVAVKVVRLFSQMAQSNYGIRVDSRMVEEIGKTEWKVIQQVGYGRSNKEIAAALNLSEGTVRNNLSSILSKLELRDRTQLAIWAVQTGVTTRLEKKKKGLFRSGTKENPDTDILGSERVAQPTVYREHSKVSVFFILMAGIAAGAVAFWLLAVPAIRQGNLSGGEPADCPVQ